MRETLRETLRTAWHGTMTVAEIESREGVNSRRIRRFWESERGAGRLPEGPRPHFIDAASREVRIALGADASDVAVDYTADDSPIGGPMGVAIPLGDPLLRALQTVHGAERWRAVDGMPVRVLNDEAAGRVPARWRVAQLAALRDAFVAALMRLAEQRRGQMIERAAA